MEHTRPGPCGGEPSGQDVWANIWCAVLAVMWAVHLLQWAWNPRWPGPEVLLSLLPVNLGLYRFKKFPRKRKKSRGFARQRLQRFQLQALGLQGAQALGGCGVGAQGGHGLGFLLLDAVHAHAVEHAA